MSRGLGERGAEARRLMAGASLTRSTAAHISAALVHAVARWMPRAEAGTRRPEVKQEVPPGENMQRIYLKIDRPLSLPHSSPMDSSLIINPLKDPPCPEVRLHDVA